MLATGLKDKTLPKRRVTFIINSLTGGGAERVMSTLLRASRAEVEEFELSLVLLDDEPAAYHAPAWVPVIQLDARGALVPSVTALFRHLKTQRPDVTVSFLTRANVASILVGKLLRFPTIISERVNTLSHLDSNGSGMLAKLMVRFTYRLAQRIIAVSPGVADALMIAFSVPRRLLTVIANPIDVDEIQEHARQSSSAVPSGDYIVAMGRLVPNKNFGMLIEAFARSGIDGRLLVLGDGPERKALEEKINALGLTGRVEMLGFASNPFPLLSHAKTFVLPSNAEGFPNSLLEAMSLGVPVISTNCPSGPSEVLADRPRDAVGMDLLAAEYGILVQPNSVAQMADALKQMQNHDVRQKYAAKALARAHEFSVDRAKSEYWKVIRGILTK